MSNSALEFVDLRDRRDNDLLADFHDIYMPAFPIEREREGREVWERLLWGADPGAPAPKFHLLIAGRNLDDQGRRETAGGLTFEYFRDSACALIAYLAVAPPERRRGVAGALLSRAIEILHADAAETGKELRAAFAETHDPRKTLAATDSIDPAQRVRILSRLGARWIDLPYVEPEVNPGHGRTRDMILLTFPHSHSPAASIPSQTVREFLLEFYRAQGVADPAGDGDFQRMVRRLDPESLILREIAELLERR